MAFSHLTTIKSQPLVATTMIDEARDIDDTDSLDLPYTSINLPAGVLGEPAPPRIIGPRAATASNRGSSNDNNNSNSNSNNNNDDPSAIVRSTTPSPPVYFAPTTPPRPLPPLPTSPVTAVRTLYYPEVYDYRDRGSPSHSVSSSHSSGSSIMAGTSNNNAFPALDTSFGGNRLPSNAGSQTNGMGMNSGSNSNNNNQNNNNGNMPSYVAAIPVGHQQDLNYLFQQFQELQAQLAHNRDKVNDITRSAEEVARRANGTSNGVEGEYDHESDRAKIRDLEHSVTRLTRTIELYKHEQRENTSLIAQYEDALGTATEQIRNYCNDIDGRFLAQRRHYNNLLQAEKDEHLQSRLDRDHWHNMTLELCGMLRTANRLRTDEWCDEYRVIVGLQTEVRCFRRILGLEPEKPEEETGWPYLQDAPFNDQV